LEESGISASGSSSLLSRLRFSNKDLALLLSPLVEGLLRLDERVDPYEDESLLFAGDELRCLLRTTA
jgi:hypothetical protein